MCVCVHTYVFINFHLLTSALSKQQLTVTVRIHLMIVWPNDPHTRAHAHSFTPPPHTRTRTYTKSHTHTHTHTHTQRIRFMPFPRSWSWITLSAWNFGIWAAAILNGGVVTTWNFRSVFVIKRPFKWASTRLLVQFKIFNHLLPLHTWG